MTHKSVAGMKLDGAHVAEEDPLSCVQQLRAANGTADTLFSGVLLQPDICQPLSLESTRC